MPRRLIVAAALVAAVLIPATPADARPAVHCGAGPLHTLSDTRRCWGGLIAAGCDWPAARMVAIVHRESRGYPRAWNRRPVGRRRLHAAGLFQQLGTSPAASPEQQTAAACSLFHRQGMRAWALR